MFSGAPSDTSRFINVNGVPVGPEQGAVVEAGTIVNGSFVSLVGSQGFNTGSIGTFFTPLLDGLWLGQTGNNSAEASFFDNQPIFVRVNIPLSLPSFPVPLSSTTAPILSTDAYFPENGGGVADAISLSIDSITGVVPEPGVFSLGAFSLLFWSLHRRRTKSRT